MQSLAFLQVPPVSRGCKQKLKMVFEKITFHFICVIKNSHFEQIPSTINITKKLQVSMI
jgi:hypothetical protein